MDLKEVFTRASFSLVVMRNAANKFGLKVKPQVDLTGKDLEVVLLELKKLSIHSNYNGRLLTIQGISNCLKLRPFMYDALFSTCMEIYESGHHKELQGLITLVNLRYSRNKNRIGIAREECLTIIMDKVPIG